ncbi:DciA family protein [Kitasatospora sp. NPDC085464]|uniref:DciA family protein n=1 Tax=Kitasatospora sp. NPDC085464 TaxID=3364063 RepID=UPI0037CB86F8
MSEHLQVGPDLARIALARAREAARQQTLAPKRADPKKPKRAPVRSGGREPAAFAAVLERLVEEAGWRRGAAAGSIIDQWPGIVGPDRAKNWRAVGYDPSTQVLTISVTSAAWSTALRLDQARLLALLGQRFPGTVGSIRVRTGGPQPVEPEQVDHHQPVSVGRPTLKGWCGQPPGTEYRAVRQQLRTAKTSPDDSEAVNPFLPEGYGRLGREPEDRFLPGRDLARAAAEAQQFSSARRSLEAHYRALATARQQRREQPT